MTNILDVGIYIMIEVIVYILAYMIVMNKRVVPKPKNMVGLLLFCLVHIILALFLSYDDVTLLTVVTMAVLPLFIFGKKGWKYILLYPFVFNLTGIVGVSTAFVFSIIYKLPLNIILENNRFELLCHLIQMLVMIFWFSLRLLRNGFNTEIGFSARHYIVLNVIGVISCIGIGAIQTICKGEVFQRNATIGGFAISVTFFLMEILVVWQGILEGLNAITQERNQYNEKILASQRKYYESMLKHDDNLRKFRHDARAHLTVIREYASNEENKKLLDYIDSLVGVKEIYQNKNITGNRIIDIIIDSLSEDIEKNNIEFKVEGKVGKLERIEDTTICIIIYNLLMNSIEACSMAGEDEKRFINVLVGMYNSMFYFRISNSFNGKYVMKEDELVTVKKDRKVHGYGTKNVKDAVNKAGGSIKYSIEKKEFCVEVII